MNSFSNEPPPNIPKRGQKKSTPSICSIDYTDEQTASFEGHLAASTNSLTIEDVNDLRDSGISMSDNANINNFNNSAYEEYDLRTKQQEMNISNVQEGEKVENPPPIPPKSGIAFGGSLERRQRSLGESENVDGSEILSPPENYSFPKMTITENGNENGPEN